MGATTCGAPARAATFGGSCTAVMDDRSHAREEGLLVDVVHGDAVGRIEVV